MLDLDNAASRLAMILTSLLIAGFSILPETIGSYLIYAVLLVGTFLLKTKGSFNLSLEPFYVLQMIMIAFTACSLIWAEVPYWTSIKVRQLTVNLFFSAILYIAYSNEKDIWPLIRCFKWAGYIVAAYLIRYYGFNRLISMLLDAIRMQGEVANANQLGMCIAFSCLFEIVEMAHFKKISFSWPFIIPCILVISATQSRKAILILVIGVVLAFFFYYFSLEQFARSLISLVIFILITSVILYIFKTLPVFSGVYSRMEYLFNFVKGEGETGISVESRSRMIEAGWLQFLKAPVLGIGIGNAGLAGRIIGIQDFWAYLHNNYIELLCGGGIVGFSIYYAKYIYASVKLIQGRQQLGNLLFPCLIICIIKLVLDYGLVSYFEKQHEMHFLLLYLSIKYNNETNNRGEQLLSPLNRSKYIKGDSL